MSRDREDRRRNLSAEEEFLRGRILQRDIPCNSAYRCAKSEDWFSSPAQIRGAALTLKRLIRDFRRSPLFGDNENEVKGSIDAAIIRSHRRRSTAAFTARCHRYRFRRADNWTNRCDRHRYVSYRGWPIEQKTRANACPRRAIYNSVMPAQNEITN